MKGGSRGQGRRGRGDARVALSSESRAPRNACIIIMTDADRAAAPLICGAFDVAAGAGLAPACRTNEPLLAHLYSVRSCATSVGPFALASL